MRRPLYSFIIDPDLRAGIRHVKVRDGISESEQIRRGIRLWLKQQGVAVKTERQRGVKPRRRP